MGAQARSQLICCLLDDSDALQVNASLDLHRRSNGLVLIDFRRDIAAAQKLLAQVLDEALALAPYPRFPLGRPDQ